MRPAASFRLTYCRVEDVELRVNQPTASDVKISTFLPSMAAALICGAVIIAQVGRNRSLGKRLESLRPPGGRVSTDGSLRGGEARAIAGSSDNRRDEGEAPAPGTPEFEERVVRATGEMKEVISKAGDMGEGLAAFFRALPGVIKVIGGLGPEEAIAVADRLGSSGALFPPADGNSTARLMIYLLVSEQDPMRILERKDLNLDSPMSGLQVSIFGRLAMRDPDGAIEWLKGQAIGEGPRTAYERNIAFGLLARDPRRGLDYLLEHPAAFPRSGMGQVIADIEMPEAAKADLMEALPDPRYAEFRPAISRVVMRSSLTTDSVGALRERSVALQLSGDEVATFLRENPSVLMQRDPAATTEWMKEVLPDEDYTETVAGAIRSWSERDFNAAANHLDTMDRGPARDKSIKEFADVVAKMEPPSAARWALEIEEPTLRAAALREVGESWLRLDPGAAREWMKAQGIPEPDAAHTELETP
jgi:hypothetical protein